MPHMGNPRREARDLLVRMALISYGGVSATGQVKGGEPNRIGPSGESAPMHHEWGALFDAASDDNLPDLIAQARADLDAWIRRPFASVRSESGDEFAARIIADGYGFPARDCAMAMRCTPTMVRRARLAAGRTPEDGRPLPTDPGNRLAWARALNDAGLSLGQIQALTGIPKTTLHRRLARVS